MILTEEQKAKIQASNISGRAFEDIPVELTVILGSADMNIANLLKIGRGAVIELDKRIGEAVEVRCQGLVIGNGDVEVSDGRLSVRIKDMRGQSQE